MSAVLADPALKRAVYSDLVVRQLCLAVAAASPRPCDPLAELPGKPETGGHMCRRLYLMTLLSESILSGASDFTSACERWCAMAPALPPPDLVGRVCAALRRRDPDEACADIERFRTAPDRGYNRRECDWEMGSVLGEAAEDVCRRHLRPGSDVCSAIGLYRKAKGSSDAALCAANPLCLAMRGAGAAACAPLDAPILEQARAFVASSTSAVAQREAPGAGPKRSPRIDQACARARARALRGLDDAEHILKAGRLDAAPDGARLRDVAARLRQRQENLEAEYLLRSGIAASHAPAASYSFAGDWTFYYTPKAVTGCGGSGSSTLDSEMVVGPLHVDDSGYFFFFSRNISIAGSVDLGTGRISGILADPFCGEGTVSGRCSGPSECSGASSQTGPSLPSGSANTESGAFRLAR